MLIDYSKEKVEDGVKRLTSGAGVDVLLDPVGIAQEAALRCLALGWQAADCRASPAAASRATPPIASC